MWKKKIFYEEYPYTLSNPTFNIVVDTSTFENFNISLSSLAEIPPDINDFLNGFELYDQQNTRRFILTYENGVMYADTQKTITATITLSGTTLTITISNVDIWIGSTGLMKYVGDKTYYVHNVIGETVGFVVSDNSSAYPDGGVQDGYWYEKVMETDFGFEKVSFLKVTPTSDTYSISFSHDLGEIPKKVFVYTTNEEQTSVSSIHTIIGVFPGNETYQSVGFESGSNYKNAPFKESSDSASYAYRRMTATSAKITCESLGSNYGCFLGGVEHICIAMA